jgi:hypothetical protein
MINHCDRCGEVVWNNGHTCPPTWYVLDKANNGDDWNESLLIYADNAEEAASEASRKIDERDGEGEYERVLHVKNPRDNKVIVFNVVPEIEIDYVANEIGEEEE